MHYIQKQQKKINKQKQRIMNKGAYEQAGSFRTLYTGK